MKKIIAFIGYEGSGKDHSTNKLLEDLPNSVRVGFSDGIREEAFSICNMEPIYGTEYELWKASFITELNTTGRGLLIDVGESRRKKNPLVWSEYWFKKAKKINKDYIIVNDCRFMHECKSVIKLANELNCDYQFIYCSYRSGRFRPSNEETDRLAKLLDISGFSHLEDATHFINHYKR